jgi:hypothetical protein
VAANWGAAGLRMDGSFDSFGLEDDPGGVFTDVVLGGSFNCGLRNSGAVECWGRFGLPAPPSGTFIALSATVFQINPFNDQVCGLRDSGDVTCWGYYGGGYAVREHAGPFQSLGADCGVHDDGAIECWTMQGSPTPPLGNFTQVATGYTHACALDTLGSVTCFGTGVGATTPPPVGPFDAITAGGTHSCARHPNGTVVCWGDNANDRATSPSGTYRMVRAGARHTCAIDSTYQLSCWGEWVR